MIQFTAVYSSEAGRVEFPFLARTSRTARKVAQEKTPTGSQLLVVRYSDRPDFPLSRFGDSLVPQVKLVAGTIRTLGQVALVNGAHAITGRIINSHPRTAVLEVLAPNGRTMNVPVGYGSLRNVVEGL